MKTLERLDGLRIMTGAYDQSIHKVSEISFVPAYTCTMERIEVDYGDLGVVFDRGTMIGNNPTRADSCSWNSYEKPWHGKLPKVPGVDDNDVCARVRAILHLGVEEDVKKLEGLADQCKKLLPPIGFGRRKRRFARDGDELDIDRWMDGKEEPWVDYNRSGQKPSPYITLVGHFGGNCNVTPDKMFWAGAAAAAMTDALEDAGFRVRLLAAAPCWYGDGYVCTRDGKKSGSLYDNFFSTTVIKLKDYDEPLRLGPVSFGMCHAGFFRTVGFGLILQSSLWDVGGGLGSQRQFCEDDISCVTSENALLIPSCNNLEEAVKAVGDGYVKLRERFGLVAVG